MSWQGPPCEFGQGASLGTSVSSLKVRSCSVGGPEKKTHLHRISEHLQTREEVMYLAPVRTPLEATSYGSHEL